MNALIELEVAETCTRKKGITVAGVYKRGGMLYVRKRIDGKLMKYSTGKKDTPENLKWVEYHAEEIWQEKHADIKEEVLSHTIDQTLEEYGLTYYEYCPDSRDVVTHERLLGDFEKYTVPKLGHYKISELTASIISQWQMEMKYFPDPIPDISKLNSVKPTRGYSRMKNLRSALTLVLNDAVRNRKLEYSPADHVPLIENAHKKKMLLSIEEAEKLDEDELEDIFTDDTITYTENQIQILISICDQIISEKKASHHRLVWKFFKQLMIFKFYSGVRSGEAIALMWKFVDFEKKKIQIRFTMRDGKLKLPKEEKTRVIDMTAPAEEALRNLHKLSGHTKWVFLKQNRRGPYVNPYGPSRLWTQVAKRAKGFKVARFYNTRHSFTTNMLSRGVNPEWLIQQLGHENIVITRTNYEGMIEPEREKLPQGLNSQVSQLVSQSIIESREVPEIGG